MKEPPSLCVPVSIALRDNGVARDQGVNGSRRQTSGSESRPISDVGGGLRDRPAAAWNGTTASLAALNGVHLRDGIFT